jgi:hypothetical protein
MSCYGVISFSLLFLAQNLQLDNDSDDDNDNGGDNVDDKMEK